MPRRDLNLRTNADYNVRGRWRTAGGDVQALNAAVFTVAAPDGTVLITRTVGAGITLDATEGWATVNIPAALIATAAATATNGKYDWIVRRASDGSVQLLSEGLVAIKPGVSPLP